MSSGPRKVRFLLPGCPAGCLVPLCLFGWFFSLWGRDGIGKSINDYDDDDDDWLDWTSFQSQGSNAHQCQMQHQQMCQAFKPLVCWENGASRSNMRTSVESLTELGGDVHMWLLKSAFGWSINPNFYRYSGGSVVLCVHYIHKYPHGVITLRAMSVTGRLLPW